MGLLFESVTCTRCGGTGQYSWCQSYGSKCFKCAGVTETLTKRGKAAQAYYIGLLSKEVQNLQPGDKVYDAGCPMIKSAGWHAVIEVVPSVQMRKLSGDTEWRCAGDSGALDVRCEGYGFSAAEPDRVFRVAATAEQKKAAKVEALAYQATLTKTGTVRKRKAVA